MQTFWNEDHPLTTKANDLFTQLVPADGKCDAVVGELLRASSKISWDWFNNGWGCNNWSGAVIYIRQNVNELDLPLEVSVKLSAALDYVYDFSHGEPSTGSKYPTEIVTTIHEIIVQGILGTSPVDWTSNSVDMYDLSEEDYQENDDFYGDEDDDSEY
jgi:hypothetical protein